MPPCSQTGAAGATQLMKTSIVLQPHLAAGGARLDSVALLEIHRPGGGGCSSSPTRPSPSYNRSCPPIAGAASPGATTARSSAGSCGSSTPAGLAGQGRVVDLEVIGLQHSAVDRHPVALGEQENVAWHQPRPADPPL